jgi:hypothetical protein
MLAKEVRVRRSVLTFIFVMTALVADASAETRTLNLNNFDQISVGSATRISIKQGDAFRVEVTGEPEELDRLEARLRGSRIEFTMKSNSWFRSRSGSISMAITLPSLRGLALSGSSLADLDMQIGSNAFSAELSGSSRLSGRLNCGDVNLHLSGSSRVRLNGAGQRLNVSGSGASQNDMREFAARGLRASLSGSSNVTVNLDGELNADMSGASSVTYYGSAVLGSINASGGSRVRKGQ